MALINCPDCQKEISNSAKFCVNCGYRLKQNVSVFIGASGFDTEVFRLILILGILVIFAGSLFAFSQALFGVIIIVAGLLLFSIGTLLLLINSFR